MPSATWSLSVSDNSPKPPDRNLFNQAASVLRAPAYCSSLRQPSLGAEGVGLPKDINGLLPPPSDMGAMGVSAYEGAGEGDMVSGRLADVDAAWDAEDILCTRGVSKPVS
jgi:hypothetical protein